MVAPTEMRFQVEVADPKLEAWSTVALRLSIEGALIELRISRRDLPSRIFRIFDRQTGEVFRE